jgi:hypothetical protein
VEVLCLGKKKRDGSKLPKFTDGEWTLNLHIILYMHFYMIY